MATRERLISVINEYEGYLIAAQRFGAYVRALRFQFGQYDDQRVGLGDKILACLRKQLYEFAEKIGNTDDDGFDPIIEKYHDLLVDFSDKVKEASALFFEVKEESVKVHAYTQESLRALRAYA